MKQAKKTMAFLIALALCLSLIPAVSAAEPAGEGRIRFLTGPVYDVGLAGNTDGGYRPFFDRETMLWGIYANDGTLVVPADYQETYCFNVYGQVYFALMNRQTQLLALTDRTGKRLTGFVYQHANFSPDYSRGVVLQYPNGTVDVAEADGRICKGPKLDGAMFVNYCNGVFFYLRGGKFGAVNSAGKTVFPAEYDGLNLMPVFLYPDPEGCVIVQKTVNGAVRMGVSTAAGKELLPLAYAEISPMEGRTFFVTDAAGVSAIMTTDGQRIPAGTADSATCFGENYVLTSPDGVRAVDGAGRELLSERTAAHYATEDRLLLVAPDGTAALYDAQLQLLASGLPCAFALEDERHSACSMDQAGFLLYDGETYRSYDRDGKELGSLTTDSALSIGGGSILGSKLREDGDWLCDLYDRKLEKQTVRSYGSLFTTGLDGVFFVWRDGKYYYLSAHGVELNETGLDQCYPFDASATGRHFAPYELGGKTGFLWYSAPGESPFLDVPTGAWYQTGVDYCAERGLMAGTEDGLRFTPEGNMTRAMVAAVLYRLAGAPELAEEALFTDVPTGQWYSKAVNWAAKTGVASGVGGGRFDPNGSVTREQLAALFFRYAATVGAEAETAAALPEFPDAQDVSAWAAESVTWAVGVGLISGKRNGDETQLDPQGTATRAEVASILMRFCQNVLPAPEE